GQAEGCRGPRVRRPAGLRGAPHGAAGALGGGRQPRVSWEGDLAALWDDESIDDLERVERMALLAPTAPHPALGLFELASAHDGAGLEAQAAALYEEAAAAGLADADPDLDAHRQIQHASTLRNLGRRDEALAMLRDAP